MKHSITHHNVPRETLLHTERVYQSNLSLIESYIDQLLWWNKRVNLVSRDVSRETIANHITHSLVISQFKVFENSQLIVDTGTGGGLPGVPLAITNPQKEFVLNDIVTKKIMAVKQMVRKLSLTNTEMIDQSISELSINKPFLLISKHAFKVNDLIALTNHLPWTSIVLYKGLSFTEELSDISYPLSIKTYDLGANNASSFYKDKALLIISKR